MNFFYYLVRFFYIWPASNCSFLYLFPGDNEELPGPLRRDLGLGVSFPVALLAQTSSDNLPSE